MLHAQTIPSVVALRIVSQRIRLKDCIEILHVLFYAQLLHCGKRFHRVDSGVPLCLCFGGVPILLEKKTKNAALYSKECLALVQLSTSCTHSDAALPAATLHCNIQIVGRIEHVCDGVAKGTSEDTFAKRALTTHTVYV